MNVKLGTHLPLTMIQAAVLEEPRQSIPELGDILKLHEEPSNHAALPNPQEDLRLGMKGNDAQDATTSIFDG